MHLASTVMFILVSGRKYVTPSSVLEKKDPKKFCAIPGIASINMNAVKSFFIIPVGLFCQSIKTLICREDSKLFLISALKVCLTYL